MPFRRSITVAALLLALGGALLPLQGSSDAQIGHPATEPSDSHRQASPIGWVGWLGLSGLLGLFGGRSSGSKRTAGLSTPPPRG